MFPQENSRYLWLAHLSYLQLFEVKDDPDVILDVVGEYWDKFCRTTFCFDDLKDFVLKMSLSNQTRFRGILAYRGASLSCPIKISFRQWLAEEINALKLEYLLTIGNAEYPSEQYLRPFIRNAIRLLKLAEKNDESDPELPLLIASALTRYHQIDPLGPHLLTAVYILEEGAHVDMYKNKVLLVYILSELGLYTKANEWYQNLSVKEMQHETFSQSFLTRISTGCPWAPHMKTSEYADPYGLVQKALQMYDNTDRRLYETQQNILDNGRADMLFDLDNLRRTLRHSLNRRVMLLESSRIARFTNRTVGPKDITQLENRGKP